MDLKRGPAESERQYIWRLATAMESGLLDMNWTLLSEVLNKELHDDAPLAESTYRKAYQAARAYYDEVFLPMVESGGSAGLVDDVRTQRLELEKERVKMRDERNEVARIQRELARRESLIDLVKEGIREEVSPVSGYVPHEFAHTDNDVVVHLTDVHCGIEVRNFCNEYDVQVMHDRLNQYLEKIDEIRQRHSTENCFLLLGGDLISGLIHTALRLENNLDIIRQVKVVSMALTCFIQTLSDMFGNVYVYSVPGNHSRAQPKKEDNLRGENLDILVPFILSLSLQNYRNVHIYEENIDPTVARFTVRGLNVFGVHGDKDSMESVVQKLTMVFHEKPDIVLAGHRHTNGMRTVYDSKVIESGSVVGSDSYCIDHRLRNKPEQMVLVVSDDGLECLYDIQLD